MLLIFSVSTHLADGSLQRTGSGPPGTPFLRANACVRLMDDSTTDRHGRSRAGARGVVKRSASMQLLEDALAAVPSGRDMAAAADLHQVLERSNGHPCPDASLPWRVLAYDLANKRSCHLCSQGLTNKRFPLRPLAGASTQPLKIIFVSASMKTKRGISSRVELILYYAVSDRESGVTF